ncbi:UNVERIFIED_CONTAM: hypothetical protein RF648_19865 [Kocuria sp. CPCC 205274]
MPNFIAFGQNDRITINAVSYRRASSAHDNFAPSAGDMLEFLNEDSEVVATLQAYQYGNIVREDALRENL